MPSWRIHTKWESIILGYSLLRVDEFIDFPKDHLDKLLVREAVMFCGGDLESVKYYVEAMSGHDAWRESGCVLYYYIYRKYGKRGLAVAVLHATLDLLAMNITSFGIADIATFDRIVDGFFDGISKLNFISVNILGLREKIKANIADIVKDIAIEKKLFKYLAKIDPKNIEEITIYYNPAIWSLDDSNIRNGIIAYHKKKYRDYYDVDTDSWIEYYKKRGEEFQRIKMLLETISNLGVKVNYINILDISPSEAEEIEMKTWRIAMMTKVSTKYSNKHNVVEVYNGVLDLADGYLMIVRYKDGSEMFYPHYIKRSGMPERVKISAEDFLTTVLKKITDLNHSDYSTLE